MGRIAVKELIRRGKKHKRYYPVLRINGKEKWFNGFNTKREAQITLNEIEHQYNNGTYRELKSAIFSDFADKWLNYKHNELKPSTFESYLKIINAYFKIILVIIRWSI